MTGFHRVRRLINGQRYFFRVPYEVCSIRVWGFLIGRLIRLVARFDLIFGLLSGVGCIGKFNMICTKLDWFDLLFVFYRGGSMAEASG